MSMSDWFKSLFRKREVPTPKVVVVDSSPSLMEDDPVPERVEEILVSIQKAPDTVAPVDLTKPNRDLTLIHPVLAKKLEMALAECHSKGLMVYVFEGLRSYERQDLLYAQGRTAPGKIVTRAKAGQSWHNFGLAVDLVFDGDAREGIQWSWAGSYKNPKLTDDKRDHYTQVGTILEAHGLEWAGRWTKFPETPHFQLTNLMSLASAQKLYSDGGLPAVWDEVWKKV